MNAQELFTTRILPMKNRLFAYIMSKVENRHEAEDITQDVLLRMWEKRELWKDVENPEGYCIRMAHNLVIDLFRKQKTMRQVPAGNAEPVHNFTPLAELSAKDTRHQMLQAYRQLPDKQQQVFFLREEEGMAYNDIADELGITMEQVKVYIFRARNFIKQEILKRDAVWNIAK